MTGGARLLAGPVPALRAIGRRRWRLGGEEDGAVRLEPAAAGAGALAVAKGTFHGLVRDGFVEIADGTVRATGDGLAHARRALSAGGEAAGSGRPKRGAPPAPTVRIDPLESPLAWLASRKDRDGNPLLRPVEVDAGCRLHRDFLQAGLSPRVTASWDPAAAAGRRQRAGARVDGPHFQIDAARRLRRALDAVGPDLSRVLFAVCCEEVGLVDLERRLSWPKRSAKVVLAIALRQLAAHYGLGGEATGPDRQPGVRIEQAGAADYRPAIG